MASIINLNDKALLDRLRFIITCDSCGIIAAFSTPSSALAFAKNEAADYHALCLTPQEDGKRITLSERKSPTIQQKVGRF
jgi:hypothetical protein